MSDLQKNYSLFYWISHSDTGIFFVFIIIFVFERAANMDSKAVDVSCFIQMISVLSNHLLL